MKAIIGKKVGMSQIFDETGKVIPVTLIEAGPCTVVQKKSSEKEWSLYSTKMWNWDDENDEGILEMFPYGRFDIKEYGDGIEPIIDDYEEGYALLKENMMYIDNMSDLTEE